LPLEPASAEETLQRVAAGGTLHGTYGIDYFAYRRGSLPTLPPLFLGAARWDNLTIYYCRRAKVPVIDASGVVRVLHQNHGYFQMRECVSAQANVAQTPVDGCLFGVLDSSHWLDGGRTRIALMSRRHASHWLSNYALSRGWPKTLGLPLRATAFLGRSVGLLWSA
jgi:hypothetical protein